MKRIKENLVEVLALIGIINIAIGSFIYSTIAGFLITGLLFILIAIASFVTKGGD